MLRKYASIKPLEGVDTKRWYLQTYAYILLFCIN